MTSFDLAKKSLAANQRKFELGTETNFFVLDSQERLAQAELVLLQARVNYQEALAAINHASGKLLASYHLQIDAGHQVSRYTCFVRNSADADSPRSQH